MGTDAKVDCTPVKIGLLYDRLVTMKIYKEKYRKLKRLSFSYFAIGFGCHLLFWISGSEVSQDGILIEKFFLLPVGYFFYFLGTLVNVTNFFRKSDRNRMIIRNG